VNKGDYVKKLAIYTQKKLITSVYYESSKGKTESFGKTHSPFWFTNWLTDSTYHAYKFNTTSTLVGFRSEYETAARSTWTEITPISFDTKCNLIDPSELNGGGGQGNVLLGAVVFAGCFCIICIVVVVVKL